MRVSACKTVWVWGSVWGIDSSERPVQGMRHPIAHPGIQLLGRAPLGPRASPAPCCVSRDSLVKSTANDWPYAVLLPPIRPFLRLNPRLSNNCSGLSGVRAPTLILQYDW
jgi:hypothetical protein